MDYIPGKRFVDCFEELDYNQKNKTATDLALIVSEIFSFTSSHCGSLLHDQSLASNRRSRRYNDPDLAWISTTKSHSEVSDGSFLIGPVNDITLLAHKNSIPSTKCGPFGTERQYLEAFAYLGSPGTRPTDKHTRWPFERLFEVYDVVRPEYPVSKSDSATFHFSHGDLSVANILLDPTTGAVTGIIDWEMSGFRPAWLAAASPAWFDDDSCRFVMEDHQDGPDGYGDETEDEVQLLQHFNAELEVQNQELFQHNKQGVELRAMFYNLSSRYPAVVQCWLKKYEKYHWEVVTRGPFPFDLMQWIEDRLDLWDE
jgi:hypothetical protein